MAKTKLEEAKELEDQSFMEWLFHTFRALMWHTAKKYCRKDELWEEIIQESLVRLLACVPKLRSLSEEHLTGYILVTTRNTAYILLKKEGIEQERVISLDSADLPDDTPAIEERMIQAENEKALSKVWEDLPESMRYLLSSYYLLGYQTSDLARELGCGPNTVRMRLTRARRYAKKLLQQEEGITP